VEGCLGGLTVRVLGCETRTCGERGHMRSPRCMRARAAVALALCSNSQAAA